MESDTLKLKALWRLSVYETLCIHKVNFNHFSSKNTVSLMTHVFVLWLMPQTWTAACTKGDIFMHLRSIFNAIVKEEQEFWTHIRESWSRPIMKWVAISFSRGSSQPRDWTWVSCIASRFFTIWATREASVITTQTCNSLIWHLWKFRLSCWQAAVQGGFLDEPLLTLPSLFHSWVVGVCVVLCVWDDQMTGLRVIVNIYGWEDHTN